ncbi:hypothetical protein [Vulgatibacter sp.]|uniref:hypothetical protein n=1 Tax=Vulgatibacter sp. TaxID=1971226 RepID=UPI003562CE5F
MRTWIAVLLLGLAAAGCSAGADEDDDGGGGGISGTAGSGGAGGSGGSGGLAGSCDGLAYCACAETPACRVVAEPCFCPCGEFACSDDCLCGCGGGAYLGCAPAACPISTCPEGSTLAPGPDGCPVCVEPPPCDSLDACGCFADDRCAALADDCICECDFECPGTDPCDCGCGGGNYLGCYPRSCSVPTCNAGEILTLGESGCPVCVPADDPAR